MKNIMSLLILVIMGFMLYISWMNLGAYRKENQLKYSTYMEQAKMYESKEIYVDAVDQYERALKIKTDDFDTAMKIVGLYDKLEDDDGYVDACKKAIRIQKNNPDPYMRAIRRYLEMGEKKKAYKMLTEAETVLGALEEKPEADLKEISEKLMELRGEYTVRLCEAEEYYGLHYLGGGSTGAAVFSVDGKFGVMNDSNQVKVVPEYDFVNLTGEGDLTAVKQNNKYFFIDNGYNRRVITDDPASYLGVFDKRYAPAEINKVCGYVDKKMNQTHFEYEYAGSFENGYAAVKKDGKWGVINLSFSSPTGFVYDEIKLDNYGFFATYGVFFAKKDGRYSLYNMTGEELAGGFEDAKLFASRQPAAVKKDGKWGFISITGEEVIAPAYADADSFNVGYAPVAKKDSWGCIDLKGNMVIEPAFEVIQPFSNDGYAYCKQDGFSHFIKVTIYD
ncbi:MAG: WG repeat-containing protein [Oscillospiraceae bacterium]|nr:WG repeat-containing protein [Oscillospiraceae bacterium]